MKLEDIIKFREKQCQECDVCGLISSIVCSNSNFPEYEEEIYVQCVCGNFIEFIIPVN